jgi:hypothetical protein
MWNGTAEILNPRPMSRRPSPRLAGELGAGQREAGGPGSAVHQRDAVEQEPRGEGADQEVLERGLGAERIHPVVAGQDVHRDRHHLEAEEEHDQVFGAGEEHHPDGGEQHQRVVLRRQEPLPLEIPEREQNGAGGREERDGRGGIAVAVERDHLRQAFGGSMVEPQREHPRQAHHHSGEAQPSRQAAVLGRLVTPAHH